jgi:CRP-like cAMP-binding protein
MGEEKIARADSKPIVNRLLAALSPDDLGRLRRHLEPVALPLRKTLSKPGRAIEHVYFPEHGMVSLVAPLADGAFIEVGVVGREGCVGAAVLYGVDTHPAEAMVQVAGSGWRIGAKQLQREAGRSPALTRPLLRFTHALHVQVTQTAACNGRHTLLERLARWLLVTRDRIDSDVVPLTHDLLSMMLGARRAGVTVAVGALKTAGLVRNATGRVTILDHAGLEAQSCECYRVVKAEYARLLP